MPSLHSSSSICDHYVWMEKWSINIKQDDVCTGKMRRHGWMNDKEEISTTLQVVYL